MDLDVINALKAFFYLSSAAILAANTSHVTNSRLLSYGARNAPSQPPPDGINRERSAVGPPQHSPGLIETVLDKLASITVPHSYFTHFYALSLSLSLFWAYQILNNGYVFQLIALCTTPGPRSMTADQVLLLWTLMTLQATRRLLECLTLSKSSTSRMWIGHYLIGLAFYAAMSIAIWIEGAGEPMPFPLHATAHLKLTSQASLANPHAIQLTYPHTPRLAALPLPIPTPRTFLLTPIFLLASGLQHDCHAYLSGLRKYSLPTHPLFKVLVCPHYTAECVIYLSLALLGAPTECTKKGLESSKGEKWVGGSWVNGSIGAGLVFVVMNLGVTARGTKGWYAGKFGEEAVRGRWCLVPFVW